MDSNQFSPTYPTKNQGIEEQKRKLIMNPKTREEALRNKGIQTSIKRIQETF